MKINRINGSNRTFMELKSNAKVGASQAYNCSNRTFMELKFLIISVRFEGIYLF